MSDMPGNKPASQSSPERDKQEGNQQLKDANACIGLGAGVGALGAGAAVIGAVCPICFIVAPALVGAGVLMRKKAKTNN